MKAIFKAVRQSGCRRVLLIIENFILSANLSHPPAPLEHASFLFRA